MQSNKYAILLVALLLATLSLRAQYNPYWHWAKADTVNKLTVGNGGSVLAVRNGRAFWGRMTSIARVVNDEGQGSWFMGEYDSTGKQMNVTAMAGKVTLIDVQADAAGNWYVLGRFYDSAIFASGSTLTRPFPSTNIDGDHFMARFDANTLLVKWVKIVGPFVNVSARAFTMDNNKLYVAADSLGATIIRTMSFATGDITSSFKQTGASTTSSIQVDAQGNIYLAGSCSMDGMNFNGATESATTPDAYSYIVKYRSNGTHAWHQWMRDPFCFPRKLTLFKNNYLYYSGDVKDSFYIGGQYIRTPFNNGFNYFAARLDSTGSVFWAKQTDSGGSHALMNAPYHAVVTPDTALVLFAQGNGYINWGDTVETDLQLGNIATLVSFGPDKTARWARPVYTDITSNQHVATEGTAIWVTGNAYSQSATVLLDTLIMKVPARKFVPFLARTKMIRPIPVPGGVAHISGDKMVVYPVPARTALRVDGLETECILVLSDFTGREIRRIHIAKGTQQALFDVSDLPRGLYLLEMKGESVKAARKIVLE